MDLAYLDSEVVKMTDVLRTVQWRFKGGVLGAYSMAFPTASSETRFPDGMSLDLAARNEEDPEYRALMKLIRQRNVGQRKARNSRADWTSSYCLLKAVMMSSDVNTPAITGLHAVYRVLRHIWDECEAAPRSTDFESLRKFTRECVMASSASSHLHVPTAEAICSRVFAALSMTRLAAVRHAAREVTTVLRYSGSPAARVNASTAGRRILSDTTDLAEMMPGELGARRFYIAGRAFYVSHGCAFCTIGETVVALSRSDLGRLHQFMTGVQSGMFATVAQACVAPGPERERAVEISRAYERQVCRLLDGSSTIPMGDEVSLCKAYKRAFGAYIGELSGPLCAAETAELWSETLSTKHSGGLDLQGWVHEIREWSGSTAFNLGKIYKLCPAPDASPGLTLIERHEMVTNHNAADPSIMPDFERELKAQILRAHIRTPGLKIPARNLLPPWWSSYKDGDMDSIPSSELDKYLAWEGTAQMPVRSPDNPAIWKDSGLGWDTTELAMQPDKPQRFGNMLTRMVFDKEIAMPGVRHYGHEHTHKIDIKPEGHKDPARGIYSGNLRDRLNQSWMEAAVQQVGRNHPAFMIGADTEARDARVKTIVERPHNVEMIAVYYSFDISGWSPRMPPEPQHISHRIWGDLYNEPLFKTAHTITDGSTVYMNKNGFAGWFVNSGANFEGYNGKEMTMILITLMSLTVRTWRTYLVQNRLATPREADGWSAVLLAYIDDGLAKLILPKDRVEVLFEAFKDCTVDTFGRCGYTIEKSKCYPSDRFAIFLNEPYLAGRHVVHGTRAAMTICAENTEEHTSLIERLTAVSTGCRGSVMAGLDATTGIMLQAYHVHAHLTEWIPRLDPVLAAVWSYTPRAWGGLGMPTALQLGTSGGGSAFEESLRTLQRWAAISTPAKRVFLTMARSSLVKRSPAGILMSPLGGRAHGGVLVETRVPDAVRSSLAKLARDGIISPLARDFLGYSSPDSLAAYAAALISLKPGATLQEQMLNDLASAHPHAIFSAFARRIEKSSTLMQLVGQREMRRIIKANRKDATESYRHLKEMLLV